MKRIKCCVNDMESCAICSLEVSYLCSHVYDTSAQTLLYIYMYKIFVQNHSLSNN